MTDKLPWDKDTPLSLSQLLKQSMRSVDTLVSNNSLLDKMSTHLNGLLRQQPSCGGVEEEDDKKNVKLLTNMFNTASKAMHSDADKQLLSVLQRQVFSFIGITLGIKPFLDNEEDEAKSDSEDDDNKLSWVNAVQACEEKNPWAQKVEYCERNKIDIFAPERAEHERLRKLALEDYEYRQNQQQNEEESEEESEYEEVVETVQIRSRGISANNDGGDFQTVTRKKKKKKNPNNATTTTTTTTTTTNTNQGHNNNNRRQNYYRPRRRVRAVAFRPRYLERVSPETFCIPLFFPSEESYTVFHAALSSAQKTLFICIFSLTDDDTAAAIADAYQRGVDVRIITDNEQLEGCKGSDIGYLGQTHGIPFKMDSSDQFMHNKFAIVDGKTVITGSFNWSIGARFKNRENVIITNIPSVVNEYNNEFNRLWTYF